MIKIIKTTRSLSVGEREAGRQVPERKREGWRRGFPFGWQERGRQYGGWGQESIRIYHQKFAKIQ